MAKPLLDDLPTLKLGRLTLVVIPFPLWRWHCLTYFLRQARGLKN